MDMQVTEFSPAGSARTRDKLTRVYAGIGADVGMDLWNETQGELAKIRAKKQACNVKLGKPACQFLKLHGFPLTYAFSRLMRRRSFASEAHGLPIATRIGGGDVAVRGLVNQLR